MNIDKLLKPGAIAIVGASGSPTRVGGRLYNNLIRHGYQGEIYPVNPKHDSIAGRKCYPRVGDIPHPVDAVLIAVPAGAVFSIMEECGKKEIKNAVIYSSGYSETGAEGRARQQQLAALAKRFGIAVCGPNCVGIINFRDHIAMSFSQFLNAPELIPGHIAFISQSGALGGSLLNRAQDKKIGFSYFVSGGNEAVLEASDFMEYFVSDPSTRVIMVLLEGIRSAEKFLQAADRALEMKKPIIVMKVGKTEVGRKAAGSHTGSLTGADAVYDGVFRQHGIVRVDDLDDLYLTAAAFSKSRLPAGNRVGILTSTGGGGVILADRLVENGMSVPDPLSETSSALSEVVPSFTAVNNPFDLTAQLINDPQLFHKCLEVFADDNNFDAIIAAVSMVAGELSVKRASYIIEGMQSIDKPLFTWWAAGSLSAPGMDLMERSQVPYFSSAAQCVNALKALAEYAVFSSRPRAGVSTPAGRIPPDSHRVDTLLQLPAAIMTEDQGKALLAAYSIPVTREAVGADLQKVRGIAQRIGFPVALKILSPQVTHKTDVGGLRLDLADQDELEAAYNEISTAVQQNAPEADIQGFLVQEMAPAGREVIIGINHDPQFGPVIMFGLGGIFVEILKDVSIRRVPIQEQDAWEMIREIKGYRLLKGVRGEKGYDLKAVVDVLIAVSQMAVDLKDRVREIDINPLIVYPDGGGVKAVDCLIIKKGAP